MEESERSGPPRPTGLQKIFEVRETDRDVSFIRRHLTEDLVREMNLFEYETRGEDLVVSQVADEEGWRAVKETLIKNVGMNTVPVVKVVDSDHGGTRTLYLLHAHDGRDLHLHYAEKTLAYVRRLWQRDVVMETVLQGGRHLFKFRNDGLTLEKL